MFPGHATAEGTARYRDRFPQLYDAGHFRRPEHVPGVDQLWLSSIGLGTYLGEPDDVADRGYTEAIATALISGINVLDTAINYRHQRSERNIGAAIQQRIESGELKRDEILVCTKAGYLSFDGNPPADPRAYFIREYMESGIVDLKQLVGGMHCMAPAYLEDQIERSRRNLGLESIDVFYLHNPESQLAEISREVFRQRIRDAFAMLEKLVKAGNICYYGMATWSAFRLAEASRDYISLAEVVELAHEVGGDKHHFRFIQLPFSLAMPEAYALANQAVTNQSSHKQKQSLLSTAAQLGIAVIGSATLQQGQLTHGLPDFVGRILGLKSDAENAIQFSRSAPGITTSLVGMGHKERVAADLRPALVPPTPIADWNKLFTQH
ncbi:MAG TPA: aldo/keto reductase [Terriglobales bacterium]|nr:aldo/keto reductase [Terriglobales bacterium]